MRDFSRLLEKGEFPIYKSKFVTLMPENGDSKEGFRREEQLEVDPELEWLCKNVVLIIYINFQTYYFKYLLQISH